MLLPRPPHLKFLYPSDLHLTTLPVKVVLPVKVELMLLLTNPPAPLQDVPMLLPLTLEVPMTTTCSPTTGSTEARSATALRSRRAETWTTTRARRGTARRTARRSRRPRHERATAIWRST